MIFNLDRFIVSSTGHGNGKENIDWSEVRQASPRILMALLIAVVLSKPLEIKIMANEIDHVLQNEQMAWVDKTEKEYRHRHDEREKAIESRRAELTQQIASFRAELKEADDRVANKREDLDKEIEGSIGSKQKGIGPAAQSKERSLKELTQISESKHASLDPQIKLLNDEVNAQIVSLRALSDERIKNREVLTDLVAKDNGLIKRILIAHEHYFWSGTLLFLLMALLEVSPILFKMMLRLSSYDYMLENIKLKTLASKGIDLRGQLDVLSDQKDRNTEPKYALSDQKDRNIELKDAQYYEADVLRENQVGKLKIEQALTQVAQQEFLDRVKEDIKNNPSKYIRQNPLVDADATVQDKKKLD